MTFDWQTIAVALVIACAFLYIARRVYARLRSFTSKSGGAASCATGCGKCGEEVQPARPANVLIQIGRSKGGARRRSI